MATLQALGLLCPPGRDLAQLLPPPPHSQMPAGPWGEKEGKEEGLGGQSWAEGAELRSQAPGRSLISATYSAPGQVT